MSSKIFVIHALAVNRQDAPRILYEFLVSTNSVNFLGLEIINTWKALNQHHHQQHLDIYYWARSLYTMQWGE